MEQDKLKGARAFVDDLLSGGHTWKQYVDRQVQLLTSFRNRRWKITADKAHFGFQKIKVLGHVVEPGRIAPDKEKLGAIRRLLEPTNRK